MDKYLVFRNKKVAYFDTGSGDVILFVHGWMSTKEAYSGLVSVLSKKYRCVGIDIPGFGKSKVISHLKVKDIAPIIHSLVRKLRINKFYLVGHSMGGAISIIYANKHQDKIKKMVLISPFVSFRQFPRLLLILIKYVVPNIIDKTIVNPLYKFVRFVSNFVFERTESVIDVKKIKNEKVKRRAINAFNLMFQLSSLDLYKLLYGIRRDIMVIYGKKDNIVSIDVIKPILKISSHLNLNIFEDKRHFVYSYDPTDLSKKIEDFFNKME